MMRTNQFVCSMIVALGTALLCFAEPEPYYSRLSMYKTPIPRAGQRSSHLTWNMGATGMRAWFCGDTSESRELYVRSVEPGTPADGVFQPHDIVVGVNGQRFDSEARVLLGRAITEAEASDGLLRLMRWRAGEVVPVTLDLQVMGAYSATSPYNCPKSEKIVDQACAFLAMHNPIGNAPFASYSLGVGEAMEGLMLLSSGNPEYLHLVRCMAYAIADGTSKLHYEDWREDASDSAWGFAYQNMLLAEYYLATGDTRVLKGIERLSKAITDGQGIPGAWGHSLTDNDILKGYGAVNQVGLTCMLSLVLARECGVAVDEERFLRGLEFFGRFVDGGGIPYGDHPSGPSSSSNGKNGQAAVLFALLDSKPAAAWFSHLAASANNLDSGHTGNFFNVMWTHIGVVHAGESTLADFMQRFSWYRDLMRRPDHSLTAQPDIGNDREGDLGMNHYVMKGPRWGTAGYGLMYAASRRHLRILGAPHSVFEGPPVAALKTPLSLYREKRYVACREALLPLIARQSTGGELYAQAVQLERASKCAVDSIAVTRRILEDARKAGDVYRAKVTAECLKPILPAGDAELAALVAACTKPAASALLVAGETFYDVLSLGVHAPGKRCPPYLQFSHSLTFVEKHRERLDGLVKERLAGIYGDMARDALKAWPIREELMFPRTKRWQPILLSSIDTFSEERTTAALNKSICRYLPIADPVGKKSAAAEASVPDGWITPGFNDASWLAGELPLGTGESAKSPWDTSRCLVRIQFKAGDASTIKMLLLSYYLGSKGSATIYLNGEEILAPVAGSASWVDYPIQLKPVVNQLLTKELNVMAVDMHASREKLFDVTLDAYIDQVNQTP